MTLSELLGAFQEDNLWPFSKRHSWQSWRERYKKHKDEFDARIRRLQRKKTPETPNADTSANVQPPLDGQSEVERPESRKSARKLPVEEYVLQENIDIGTSAEIIPDHSEIQENSSSPAKINEVQGGVERQSNGKRKGEEPQGTGGRERKRMKGKERGVVFEDELENTYVTRIHTPSALSSQHHAVSEQHRHKARNLRLL